MGEKAINALDKGKRSVRWFGRFFMGLTTVVFFLLLLVGSGIYWLFLGHDNIEFLRERVEIELNKRIQDTANIEIGRVTLSSAAEGAPAIHASGIKVVSKTEGVDASLTTLSITPDWYALFLGELQFRKVEVSSVTLDITPKPPSEIVLLETLEERPLSEFTEADRFQGFDPLGDLIQSSNTQSLNDHEYYPELLQKVSQSLSSIRQGYDFLQDRALDAFLANDVRIRLFDFDGNIVRNLDIATASFEASPEHAGEHLFAVETLRDAQQSVRLFGTIGVGETDDETNLSINAENILAKHFINKLNLPDYPIKIELPFSVQTSLSWNRVAERPLNAWNILVQAGEGWFSTGPKADVNVTRAEARLTLDRDNNRFVVEPSEFLFTENLVVPEGEIILGQKLMDPYRFQLMSSNNYFKATDVNAPPVTIDMMRSEGAFQPRHKLLSFSRVIVRSEDVNAEGAVSVGFDKRTPSLAAAADIGSLDAPVLKQVWPIFVAPSARNWTLNNLERGTFEGGTFFASVPGGVLGNLRKGAMMKPEEMQFDFTMTNAVFRTFGEFPRMENASFKAAVRGISFNLDLSEGEAIADDGDKVDVTNGSFVIEDFRFPGPTAKIALGATGAADDIGAIADRSPVRALERASLEPDGLAGEVDASVRVSVPLKKDIQPGEVEWNADLKVKDFTSAEPIDGRQVKNASGNIEIDPDTLKIKGEGVIDGIKADIDMSRPLKDGGQDGTVAVKVVLTDADRKKLGIDLEGYLNGPVAVEILQNPDKDTKEATYRVNLSTAELRLDFLGWRKAEGIKAEARMTLVTTKSGTRVKDFELVGDGFEIIGDLLLSKKGEILNVELSQFALKPGDKVSISAKLKPERTYDVVIDGQTFDARSLITHITNAPAEEEAAGYRYQIKTTMKQVVGYQNVIIKDLLANLTLRGSTVLKLAATGLPDRSVRPFSFNYGFVRNRGDVLRGEGADIGSLLRFTNIYYRSFGGSFAVSGVRPPGQKAMNGNFQMRNFALVDEPALKGITAGRDAAGRSAVKFNILDVNFSEQDRRLTLTKGLLSGDEVGGTYRGVLNRRTKAISFTGTYVPAYVLNNFFSKIPLVGPIIGNGREGLIGVTFKVEGTLGQPRVTVNPLSALAPGFLRQIFKFRQNTRQTN